VLQHQAVRTSHDTVLYVEHSQCYNTRLCAHLTTLCSMSNTANATTPGCAHVSRHCAVCRTQPVLQHQAVRTSHDTVLYAEHSQCYSNTRLCTHLTTLCWNPTHTLSATLWTQPLFKLTHLQLSTAINFSGDVVSSPTACSLRIRVQISIRRPITLIDDLLTYPQSLQANVSIVPLSRPRPLTPSFCPIQYSLKHISLCTK